MVKRNVIVDALKVKYNDVLFYVAVISSKKLFSISEVSRVDENPGDGYQRLLGKARAKKIADYIREGNVIPGALVLSAQEGGVKKYDNAKKKLHISSEPKSFLVIDGQHRLYGAFQYEKDIPIPVCIFDKLEKTQEVQYFLDVNGTQRGVPKTLQLELTKFTSEPETKEALLVKLFTELNEEPASPLSGKLSGTRSVTGKLSHVPFQSGIGAVWDNPPMNTFNYEQKKTVLINFLSAMEDVLIDEYGNASKLTNAAFFQALMAAFIDASNIAMYKHQNYKKGSFKSVLSSVAEINFEDYSGTNKKVINELAGVIKGKINEISTLPDDLF
jgi:DGQHR domain-containing protein